MVRHWPFVILEAKVLAVLLEQVDTVLNKEDILSHVWPNKIVSEQVVFQNISHLRNLFGNEAIKTFPKRGYQWQLSTEVVSPETQYTPGNQHSQNRLDSSQQPARSIPAKRRPFWQLAALASIIFITVGVIYSQSEFEQENTDSVIKLAYIPMTNLDDKTARNMMTSFLKALFLKIMLTLISPSYLTLILNYSKMQWRLNTPNCRALIPLY